ncbi:ABC transporter permease [Streptomyces sp. NPDC050085]|uniref:ABC transporter permease n=1 Tax=Streptomyces sp. NPDC050085 TaxID=3365600 RepID=UPI0037988B43
MIGPYSRLSLSQPKKIGLSRISWRDLLAESVAGILQRPGRSALTAVGTVLGVGTFVAILGLTATASSQIDGRFNALSATEVSVEDISQEQNPFAKLGFPEDADKRVERLHGVEHAGVFWPVDLKIGQNARPAPIGGNRGQSEFDVVAASSGVLKAAEPTMRQGRIFDSWHDQTKQRVAIIGASVASRLGIYTLETQPAVFIGNTAFTVIGVIGDVRRDPDVLLSIVVPNSTAKEIWGPPTSNAQMLISTRLGAAQQVASEAPVALDPAHAEYFKVTPPQNPRKLRNEVNSDMNQLFILLAIVCLLIGTLGIANTTLVSVLERTSEIGLRRALGARGRHITTQFLMESGALGGLGGLLGTAVGTVTVVLVAVGRDWTPIVHPVVVASAPIIGAATGVFAGIYPAWRASRIQPVEALRR